MRSVVRVVIAAGCVNLAIGLLFSFMCCVAKDPTYGGTIAFLLAVLAISSVSAALAALVIGHLEGASGRTGLGLVFSFFLAASALQLKMFYEYDHGFDRTVPFVGIQAGDQVDHWTKLLIWWGMYIPLACAAQAAILATLFLLVCRTANARKVLLACAVSTLLLWIGTAWLVFSLRTFSQAFLRAGARGLGIAAHESPFAVIEIASAVIAGTPVLSIAFCAMAAMLVHSVELSTD